MTPLSQMTIGELISTIRDTVFILGVPYLGWKARSWIQPAIDFFKRANSFFDLSEAHIRRVESGMRVLLNNHLSHIQSDLGHISGRVPRGFAYTSDMEGDRPDEMLEAQHASSEQETANSDGNSGA